MAQQMSLPLTISCYSKSRLVLPSWFYRLTRVVPDKIQKSRTMIVVIVGVSLFVVAAAAVDMSCEDSGTDNESEGDF